MPYHSFLVAKSLARATRALRLALPYVGIGVDFIKGMPFRAVGSQAWMHPRRFTICEAMLFSYPTEGQRRGVSARPTQSLPLPQVCVESVVRVTLRTMSFGYIALPAMDINVLSNSLQVKRINASPIPTQMVYNQTRWYCPLKQYVGKAMSFYLLLVVREKSPIASRQISPCPLPTPLWGNGILLLKAFDNFVFWRSWSSHILPPLRMVIV